MAALRRNGYRLIPEVQSTEDLLRTRGEIQAELFGGHGRISKLEIEGPFSSLASIKLTAAFRIDPARTAFQDLRLRQYFRRLARHHR